MLDTYHAVFILLSLPGMIGQFLNLILFSRRSMRDNIVFNLFWLLSVVDLLSLLNYNLIFLLHTFLPKLSPTSSLHRTLRFNANSAPLISGGITILAIVTQYIIIKSRVPMSARQNRDEYKKRHHLYVGIVVYSLCAAIVNFDDLCASKCKFTECENMEICLLASYIAPLQLYLWFYVPSMVIVPISYLSYREFIKQSITPTSRNKTKVKKFSSQSRLTL